jgi:hypothetical protein
MGPGLVILYIFKDDIVIIIQITVTTTIQKIKGNYFLNLRVRQGENYRSNDGNGSKYCDLFG